MKRIFLMTLAAAVAVTACQKMPAVIDADGEFLVATTRDDGTDFSKYATFTVADSIFFIDSYMRGEMVKNSFTDGLVDEFRQRMEALGYAYVPIEDIKVDDTEDGTGDDADGGTGENAGDGTETAAADLGIQLTYISETSYYVDYAYPYWWLGYDAYWSPYWTGAWYYPYPVTYEFTANSLLADMADQTVTGDDGESHPIVWSCTLSGESGSMRYDYVRFRTAIRQAFDQSSYLGKTH